MPLVMSAFAERTANSSITAKSEGLTYKIIKDDFMGIENAIGYERIRGANSE